MAESKSTCFAFDFNDHSEKSAKFDPFPINRLDADSECAGGPAEGLVVRPNHARVCDDRVPHRLAWPGLPVTSAVNFDWE